MIKIQFLYDKSGEEIAKQHEVLNEAGHTVKATQIYPIVSNGSNTGGFYAFIYYEDNGIEKQAELSSFKVRMPK